VVTIPPSQLRAALAVALDIPQSFHPDNSSFFDHHHQNHRQVCSSPLIWSQSRMAAFRHFVVGAFLPCD
jgi:hypothetical protein